VGDDRKASGVRGLDHGTDDRRPGYRPARATRLECDLDNIGAVRDDPMDDLLGLRG
jgi:hypothetical protein